MFCVFFRSNLRASEVTENRNCFICMGHNVSSLLLSKIKVILKIQSVAVELRPCYKKEQKEEEEDLSLKSFCFHDKLMPQ